MKKAALTFISLCVFALTLSAQQATYTPPKNDKIAPPLNYSADVLKDSPRHGEWVDIAMPGGPALKSWVVYPERKDKGGVVLIIHDIYGMGDWPRAVADQLAKDGFIAIAPDLLSGKGPNGGGAESLGAGVNQAISGLANDEVVARLNAALAYGKSLPSSNGKTGVVGFCWGGDRSFAYAVAQPALSAAVVFYGQAPRVAGQQTYAPDEAQLANIKAPIIGFYGGTDNRVTSTVDPTIAAMKKLGKSYESHIFDGAGHGFVRNQGTEPNYKAAEQAWPLVVNFFQAHLK